MNRSVLLTGGGVILLILMLDATGAFRLVDAQSRDLQQQHVQRPFTPMSSDIVHVDIDDGALQRIGRWPWSRTLIADCIEALHDAGARTIAVDVEFAEPAADPGDDRRLAAAVADDTVLAALLQPDRTEASWLEAGGTPEGFTQTLALLSADIDLEPSDTESDLAPMDRDAFATHEIAMKRLSLWSNATVAAPTGFAEQALQQAYLRQVEAERVAIDRGLMQPVTDVLGSPMDRLPLPTLTANADALGYVNISRRDADGVVRSFEPWQSMRAGRVTSLGVAAALHYLGHEPSTQMVLMPDARSLPMVDGAVPLAWPYTRHGTGWQSLLRQGQDDGLGTGHLSMATIAELVQAETMQADNRQQLAQLSLALLRVIRQSDDFTSDDLLAPPLQDAIADEYEFTLGELTDDESLADHFTDPDTLDYANALRNWRILTRAIEANTDEIKMVRRALQDQVQDKLVFIGWTATGSIADFVPTVAGPRTPGVVVHAVAANMVLTGHRHAVAPPWLGPLLIIVIGAWITLLVASTTPWVATACSAVLLAAYVYLAAVLAFASWHLFLPIVAPFTSGVTSWAACTGLSAILIQRDKRRITRQFRTRVSDRLVDTLIDNPAAVSMAGQQREITVLFADLAGFTSLSEQLGSERTVALANEALTALTNAIVDHDGYVNKFLGDGLMAFWSAFEPQPDQASRACQAAAACHQAMQALNETRDLSLGLRIGITTGHAIVGDCGAPPDLNDYTAIGDTVNLAARLESANKQLCTSTLIDDTTCRQAGDDAQSLPIGPTVVVGQSTPTFVHALLDASFSEPDCDVARRLQTAIASKDREAARAALELMGDRPALDALAVLWAEIIDGDQDLVLRLATK